MKIFSYLNSLGMLALLMTSLLTLGFTNEAYALNCPSNKVPQAGLCYDPPQANHSCTGISCAENCPSGYSATTNNFCHYTAGPTTYTEAPHKKNSSHPRSCGALHYANCRTNYYMDACGICSFHGKWDVTRHTYTRPAGFSPDVSAAFNNLGSTAMNTWQQSLTGAEAAYNSVQSEMNAVIDAAQLEIFRVAGNAAIDKQKDFLLQLSANFLKLQQDPDAVNIMKRLVINSATKDFGSQSQADMLYIGERLGLIQGRSNSIISNQPHAAWGVYSSFGASALYAGVDQTIGMVANTYKDNGLAYGIGGIFSTGGSLGTHYAEEPSNAAQVGIFWQPNGIDAVKGGFVGMRLSAAMGMGGEIGLQWAISQGMKGASAAIPGFYLAYGTGMEVSATLKGGYSYLAK
jgi:hypothetical protein